MSFGSINHKQGSGYEEPLDYGNEFIFHLNDNWESCFGLLLQIDILMVYNLVLLVVDFY